MQNPFQRPPTTGCPSRLSIEPWPSMTRTVATPGEGLWRLDEARRTFSCQGCRRQVSHLHEIDERIEAPSHRLTRAALRMRQYRPEAAKRGRRGGGRPGGRDISLQRDDRKSARQVMLDRSLSAWKVPEKPPLSQRSFNLSSPTSSSRRGGILISRTRSAGDLVD